MSIQTSMSYASSMARLFPERVFFQSSRSYTLCTTQPLLLPSPGTLPTFNDHASSSSSSCFLMSAPSIRQPSVKCSFRWESETRP